MNNRSRFLSHTFQFQVRTSVTAFVTSMMLSFLTLGCAANDRPTVPSGPLAPSADVARVDVIISSTTLSAGQTADATASIIGATGAVLAGRSAVWSSSDPSAATVDANGKVTAVALGEASIVAASGGKSGFANVRVIAATAALASGTIFLSQSASAFAGGPETQELFAINPNTSVARNITQSADDETSPEVSPDGRFLLYESNSSTPMYMRVDGTAPSVLPVVHGSNSSASWLPDGRIRYLSSAPFGSTFAEALFLPPAGTVFKAPVDRTSFSALGARSIGSPNEEFEVYVRDAGVWLWRRSTKQEAQLGATCSFTTTCTTPPIWKPDGSVIYVLREGAIWEIAIPSGASRKIYAAANLSRITISPDGQLLAFRQPPVGLIVIQLSGVPNPKVLYQENRILSSPEYTYLLDEPMAWSPDSKSIAFFAYAKDNTSVFGINFEGSGRRTIRSFGFSQLFGISWGR